MFQLDWAHIFAFINLIFSSATVILAFSLFIYVLTHNLLSNVGRSFAALLACVTIVYAGDVAVGRVTTYEAAVPWLRLQWLGIAFMPAAYLHFSHSLLSTTNARSRRRRATVIVGYALGTVLCLLAVATDWLVYDNVSTPPPVAHLSPGPVFPIYVLFFIVTAMFDIRNVYRARQRCLTPTARRRMTYLTLAFATPGIGVFPFLILVSVPHLVSSSLTLIFATIGNLFVGVMLVVLTYTVAYYGVLAPDRAVRQSLIYYLLRGPILGTLIVILILSIPDTRQLFGLPREMVLVSAVVATIILLQVTIHLARPLIDRLIYWRDRTEVAWLAEIDKHLLTSTDLQQVLENILVALCEELRTPAGFVAIETAYGKPNLEAVVGPYEAAANFLQSDEFNATAKREWEPPQQNEDEDTDLEMTVSGKTWLFPLREPAGEEILGWLGLAIDGTRAEHAELTSDEQYAARKLLHQGAKALADRRMQQSISSALLRMMPEINRVQAWRSVIQYSGESALSTFGHGDLTEQPDFEKWVRDALTHYWGGPKLTDSPLLKLRVVSDVLAENDNNPGRALRAVLKHAIELQRPNGDRKLTATEWMLYNILDMKFIQGERVRDIAARLAMSESDLYRKQRVAITEVAKTLADMEKEKTTKQNSTS